MRLLNHRESKYLVMFLLFVMTGFGGLQAQQQMENSMSQYFRNRMLWNAAYTGADGGKIYAMQNRSWAGFDGAPVVTSFSGEVNFGKNSSGGVQVLNDVAGVLYRTYGIFNYAYRIQFGKEHSLRMGVSLSFNSERLNNRILDGMTPDPTILNNINSSMQFDGNFGFAYRKGALDLGLSFFRLGENLRNSKENNANLAVSQLGIGYRLKLGSANHFVLKPLAMFRLYRETSSVVDIGAELGYDEFLQVMTVYQTTGNFRTGAGLRKAGLGEANFFYNTNTRVANTASQQYELGLVFYLKKKD